MESNLKQILNNLEALVYSQGGQMETKKVLNTLGIDEGLLTKVIEEYNTPGRGLCLVRDDITLALRVSVEQVPLVEEYAGNKSREVLSKASLEVLSIVLYKGAATASEIDYIRGVNSAYTLRQLSVRGLLNKSKQGSGHIYKPSVNLLSILGITDLSALPARDDILRQLKDFERCKEVQTEPTD